MRALSTVAVVGLSVLALPSHASRPDDPSSDELFKFEAGDTVESFDTARFRIHFTRAGVHSVPLTDADTSGVPDHVEEIGGIYEDVLDFYTTVLGYRPPLTDESVDPTGDGRFDVYLVDFGFSADGAFRAEGCDGQVCEGFMVQENDFSGYGYPSRSYANRLLASHELFHAVQAAYSSGQGSVFGEGTAVWASEQFDPTLDDLELYSGAYLEESDRPLDADGSGPVDSFTYGSAIFWEYLAETFGDDVIRTLWEACGDAPGSDWFDLIDGVLVDAGASGFADVFADFAVATLMTGSRADPARSFDAGEDLPELELEGVSLPLSEERFLVFTSSYRTLRMNPGDRGSVRAVLKGAGENVDGVRLVMAPITGDVVGDIVEADGLDATLDASAADFVLVQVINTRQSGNGARPALCIGSAQEVDACLLALDPPPVDEVPDPEPEEPEGCGAGGSGSAIALLALLALVRTRRVRGVPRLQT